MTSEAEVGVGADVGHLIEQVEEARFSAVLGAGDVTGRRNIGDFQLMLSITR